MHSSSPPGARVRAAGQSSADSAPAPVNSPSTTEASVRVTLPVFVTRNVYVTVSPSTSCVLSADFTIVIAGDWVAAMFTSEGSETTGSPVGGLPVAVAELSTAPASTSACCTA